MLSKKECKYRSKIIAENHLDKNGQRYLDQYVNNESLTYKKVYLSHRLLHSMLIKYNFSNLCVAMRGVGASCTQMANTFQNLAVVFASVH